MARNVKIEAPTSKPVETKPVETTKIVIPIPLKPVEIASSEKIGQS